MLAHNRSDWQIPQAIFELTENVYLSVKIYIMVRIVRIVEQDIAPKLDAEYVEQFLGAVEGNVGIAYACTKGDWRRNYSWKKDGWQYYRIVLPYEKVAAMNVAEVREWMLQLAKERLGLMPKKPAAALA